MSVQPVDADVFARIKADHRAGRGPFANAVVAPHELLAHYDVRNIKLTQCTWSLRQIGTREVLCHGDSKIRLFVTDPALAEARPAEVMAAYRRERGLPTVAPIEPKQPGPAPSPSDRRASSARWASIRDRLAADIATRSGPFSRDVLTVADAMEFYGAGYGPQSQVSALLRKLTRRTVMAQTKDFGTIQTTTLYVVDDEPELLAMKPRELLNRYRQGAGLPAI